MSRRQLSRGMIAYGSILALQSPEFVQGVRVDRRRSGESAAELDRPISLADPALCRDPAGRRRGGRADRRRPSNQRFGAHDRSSPRVWKADAYTIQARRDPRRRWAVQPIAPTA
jgi:hypothetical protein